MDQITHEQLRNRLRAGSTRFFFRKTNGELRPAYGTTDLARIPNHSHPKGGDGPNGATCYFDLDKNAWRSVSHSQEIWANE
jgi:hypothetical protein